jgi:hypothetical protein
MPAIKTFNLIAFFAGCLFVGVVFAERYESFGDYQIHYNAFTTDLIEPSVARAYNITRSKNRALVNIAVLRRTTGIPLQPVRATVTVEAVNLNAQLRTIEIRELNDRGAIYYIGELPVGYNETLNFKLEVTPEGESTTHNLTFKQEFYAG